MMTLGTGKSELREVLGEAGFKKGIFDKPGSAGNSGSSMGPVTAPQAPAAQDDLSGLRNNLAFLKTRGF